MTEAEKEEIRNKQKTNADRLEKAFAPFFLGQMCPARNAECVGPACMWFMRQVDGEGPQAKIIGGNCSVNVLAQGVAGGLVPAAFGLLEQQKDNQPQQRLLVPQR